MPRLWIFLGCILYILSPIDLVPERLLGPLGFIDDLLVLVFMYLYFSRRPATRTARDAGEEIPAGSSPGKTDPYEALGISRNAAPDEIKSAYRQLANKYHPDKVSHLGEEFRVMAEKKFKEIQAAYEELNGKP